MKFYIATSLSNAKSHNIVRDGLREFSYEISYDWSLHGSVKSVSKQRLEEVAICELMGVSEADFLIALLPGGGGTHVEIGFALGLGKPIFLHARDPQLFELGPQTNAFYHHPAVHTLSCPLDEVALAVHTAMPQSIV